MSNPLTGWRYEEKYPPSATTTNHATLNSKGWGEIKDVGSEHYKTEGVEPIDLIKDLGLLRNFALANIIKYASRNAKSAGVRIKDMNKIIHYAEMLKTAYGGEE